jgi:excisionase family DNA binding protein
MTKKTEPAYLTIEDAISFSGIRRSKLYILMNEGSIRAVKLGKRVLIEAATLQNFMAELPAWKPGAAKAGQDDDL